MYHDDEQSDIRKIHLYNQFYLRDLNIKTSHTQKRKQYCKLELIV